MTIQVAQLRLAEPFQSRYSDPRLIKQEVSISEEEIAPQEDTIANAIDLDATYLISSPYPEIENQLILKDLDPQSKVLAFALSILQPIRADYATAPYLESFNWSEVFSLLRALSERVGVAWEEEMKFYVVIFRSKLNAGIDRDRLGELDQRSHEEACASGGLLKYWFGSPNDERRNLATCLWRNHPDAVAGGAGPWHHQARAAARAMYESITFHTHTLVIEAGGKGWRLEEYSS